MSNRERHTRVPCVYPTPDVKSSTALASSDVRGFLTEHPESGYAVYDIVCVGRLYSQSNRGQQSSLVYFYTQKKLKKRRLTFSYVVRYLANTIQTIKRIISWICVDFEAKQFRAMQLNDLHTMVRKYRKTMCTVAVKCLTTHWSQVIQYLRVLIGD